MESSSLVGGLTNSVKEHSRAFGVAGAVIGAILVIYYCGSINFYPSGLTIADTLFFLWVVVVFGFYYSAVAFAFFIASIFWVAVFAKPINFIRKLTKSNADIIVPLPKSDGLMILGSGFLVNIFIFGVSYAKGHPLVTVFFSLLAIGFIYTLIENLSKIKNSNDKILDSSGKPIRSKPINPQIVRNVFYVVIYAAPLVFGQVGGGVTRITFETMGIRQEGITLYIEAKGYESILKGYESEGLISGLTCSEVCTLKDANILFTSIGTNSKLETHGKNGVLQFVLPTVAIKLIANPKPRKSSKEDTEKSAAS